MTREELLGLLTDRFCEDFADRVAARVLAADAVATLYDAVTSPPQSFPSAVRRKVLFRGAYVLERIYFARPACFMPFAARFCRTDFAACTDASARRHFGKIMAHLLRRYAPEPAWMEDIAAAAAEWAVEPGTRVAVRVWAVEVLGCCRERVRWVAESWDDILGAVEQDATPGIASRMRTSWRKPS